VAGFPVQFVPTHAEPAARTRNYGELCGKVTYRRSLHVSHPQRTLPACPASHWDRLGYRSIKAHRLRRRCRRDHPGTDDPGGSHKPIARCRTSCRISWSHLDASPAPTDALEELARETTGAASTRSSLRPLIEEGQTKMQTSGTNAPRERETLSPVIASEAKQSIFPCTRGQWIASLRSQCGG
jgi:hypothetical protein